MALDFIALQTEVYARGFSDLNDGGTGATRVKRWINDAMHEIDGKADWPYRQVTTTGAAPLTISDFGTIESVTNTAASFSTTLTPADRRDLRRWFGDLTTAGTAIYYYVTAGTTINVYPVQSGLTLTVDYWKIGPDLSANGDAPLMPDRYRMAIVDYAVARASRDRGDLPGAQEARQSGDVLLALMSRDLLSLQHQATQDFVEMVGDDC